MIGIFSIFWQIFNSKNSPIEKNKATLHIFKNVLNEGFEHGAENKKNWCFWIGLKWCIFRTLERHFVRFHAFTLSVFLYNLNLENYVEKKCHKLLVIPFVDIIHVNFLINKNSSSTNISKQQTHTHWKRNLEAFVIWHLWSKNNVYYFHSFWKQISYESPEGT